MKRLVFLSVIYFPGTLLHELSHFVFAKILLVPVYGFTVLPRRTENGLEFGHVRIQKVDIFRRSIIALAPFLVGVISLSLIVFLLVNMNFPTIGKLIAGYALLCVGNMMIPSREDLLIARPGIIVTVVLALIIITALLLRSQGMFL